MNAPIREELLLTRREILAVLFRHKWQMLAIFLASIAIAAFFAYYMISPSYETEATIIISTSALTEPLRDSPGESEFEKLAGFHTQRDIIESERMAAEAVRRTRLAERRVIGRVEQLQIWVHENVRRPVGRLLGIESWQKAWDPVAAAVAAVDEWVRTAAVPDSKALRITARARNAQEAVDILNAIIDAHTEYYYGVVRARAEGVANFLEQEFARMTQELRESETALLRFKLADRLDVGKLEKKGIPIPKDVPSFVGITDSLKVQDEIKLYILKLEEELRVASQIPDNERRERLRADLDKRLAIYLNTVNALPDRELEMVRLRRRFDTASENFQILQRNLVRARIVAGGETQKIRLVEVFERPSVKDTAISPRKRLMLLLAAALGAVVALTWAFVSDYLDHTFRSRQDVERFLNLRLLGSLPRIP